MDLPLTAANYAAAGMPNNNIDKATRRTKKVDRRRQGSFSLSVTQIAGDNTFPLTDTATTNTSLNVFGIPAAIYGQAPGAAYESHTYKSIYADAPLQEQLPLPEISLPGLSFADQSLKDTGFDDTYGSFDFDAYMTDPNCTFDNDSAVKNTVPQKNTNSVNDFFTWAGIPNQNVASLNNNEKIDADFFTTANIANTNSSEIHAMLGYGNSSSPQDNNHNFKIFKATSLEYGPAGVQVLKDAETIISARSSLSGAGSTASSITETSAPVTKALPGTVAPDTPATPLSLQELEAANKALTQELAFQNGLHQADVRRRKLEAKRAIQRREDEARLKKKADARYKRLIDQRKANQVLTKQLADQKETNNTLRELLVQEKTSRLEDKKSHDAEFKAQTELVVKANAIISRQVSEENMKKKQIAQKKTQVVTATTTREAESMRAPIIQKPNIDKRKLLAAKKPVASIQAPEKLVSAYDEGRKTTRPSNVATAINLPRATESRKRPASDIPAISALTREHAIKKARISVSGDAPRKSVPDGKGKFYWDKKFNNPGKLTGEAKKEAEAKHNGEWLKNMNEYTKNKVPGNSLGIRGHLPDPKRFNDKGRF